MRSSWAALILGGFDEGLGFAISEIQLTYSLVRLVRCDGHIYLHLLVSRKAKGPIAIRSLWLLQVKGQWEVGLLDSDFVVTP